jgi:hypothetical protein
VTEGPRYSKNTAPHPYGQTQAPGPELSKLHLPQKCGGLDWSSGESRLRRNESALEVTAEAPGPPKRAQVHRPDNGGRAFILNPPLEQIRRRPPTCRKRKFHWKMSQETDVHALAG